MISSILWDIIEQQQILCYRLHSMECHWAHGYTLHMIHCLSFTRKLTHKMKQQGNVRWTFFVLISFSNIICNTASHVWNYQDNSPSVSFLHKQNTFTVNQFVLQQQILPYSFVILLCAYKCVPKKHRWLKVSMNYLHVNRYLRPITMTIYFISTTLGTIHWTLLFFNYVLHDSCTVACYFC